MKNKRHEKIIELISKYSIETQEELAKRLNDEGFIVTQATVSRDIKKLDLIKVKASGNHQKYTLNTGLVPEKNDKLIRVLRDAITGMDDAKNILVIRTVSGMAMAAAAALDSLHLPEIVGCVGGDDTIICVSKDEEGVITAMEKIRGMI